LQEAGWGRHARNVEINKSVRQEEPRGHNEEYEHFTVMIDGCTINSTEWHKGSAKGLRPGFATKNNNNKIE
jgi:hypothetical protein